MGRTSCYCVVCSQTSAWVCSFRGCAHPKAPCVPLSSEPPGSSCPLGWSGPAPAVVQLAWAQADPGCRRSSGALGATGVGATASLPCVTPWFSLALAPGRDPTGLYFVINIRLTSTNPNQAQFQTKERAGWLPRKLYHTSSSSNWLFHSWGILRLAVLGPNFLLLCRV